MRRGKTKKQAKVKLFAEWQGKRAELKSKGEKPTGILKSFGGYWQANYKK